MPTEEELASLDKLKVALQQNQSAVRSIANREVGTLDSMEAILLHLKRSRPNDRSEIDRRYAVTITDFEKVIAYFKTYIVDEYMLSSVSQSPSKSNE